MAFSLEMESAHGLKKSVQASPAGHGFIWAHECKISEIIRKLPREPIGPPSQAICAWIPADDAESPTGTPQLWDQTTGTGCKAPEIDSGDGRSLVLEYP